MINNIPEVKEWITSAPENEEEYTKLQALDIELTRYVEGVGFFFLAAQWSWYFMPAPLALSKAEVSKYLEDRLDGQRRLFVRKVPKRLNEILTTRII